MGSSPVASTIKIELDLTEKESGYLIAAVIEFYHKMRVAEDEGPLVVNLAERLKDAKSLWHKVDKEVNIDGY